MAWTSAVPEPRRDDSGAVLCSTSRCDRKATVQATVACAGCDSASAQARSDELAGLSRLSDLAAAAEDLTAQLIALPAGADDEEAAAALAAQRLELAAELGDLDTQAREIAPQIQRSRNVAAQLEEPHTHPVFGCDAHAIESVG